ncbi:MAG: hypothetical protein EHM93_07515 [Bacteroidales bacterium]|nr:MAG: hypothetical protein EHM93_07515 [Bacteroidales bacterium]
MERKNIIVRNKRNETVGLIGIEDGVLHGHCEWYNSKGKLISYGLFKKGYPFTGTFLNWSNFLPISNKNNKYDQEFYCKDWITIYESSFLSESPKYEKIIEAYCNGLRLI